MDSAQLTKWTDKYFTKTKQVISKNPPLVTYAVFVRRPTLMTTQIGQNWLKALAKTNNFPINIQTPHQEGEEIGAGDPLLFITARMDHIVEAETLLLQKIGPPCVAAMNARDICLELPHIPFLAMDARHNTGQDMCEMMAYAAAVGSKAAQQSKAKACGFIGNATDATAHYFGKPGGLGTMPHALIGAYDSTLKAAIAFHETFPDDPLTVLVDYFGQEMTDSLEICRHFKSLADQGLLSIRLDTHGGRYIEGLTLNSSYEILEQYAPSSIRQYQAEDSLKHLVGPGTSAAAIWHLRQQLDAHGFNKVKIVTSSGFNVSKCRAMRHAKAPIDLVGTGSFLPEKWNETYATADIICYDGHFSVKTGREFLIKAYQDQYGKKQML